MNGANILKQGFAIFAFSGFMAVGTWAQSTTMTPPTPNPDVVHDQKDIRQDRRDVYQDTHDIRQDRTDVLRDKANVLNDKADILNDRT
jgi:hypothetical protein